MRSSGQPRRRGTVATFSNTVRCGKSAGACRIVPMRRRLSASPGSPRGRPSMTTDPLLGAANPLRRRSSVVLPAPLLPMTATDSPGSMRSEMSRTMVLPFEPITVARSMKTEEDTRAIVVGARRLANRSSKQVPDRSDESHRRGKEEAARPEPPSHTSCSRRNSTRLDAVLCRIANTLRLRAANEDR